MGICGDMHSCTHERTMHEDRSIHTHTQGKHSNSMLCCVPSVQAPIAAANARPAGDKVMALTTPSILPEVFDLGWSLSLIMLPLRDSHRHVSRTKQTCEHASHAHLHECETKHTHCATCDARAPMAVPAQDLPSADHPQIARHSHRAD